MQQRILCVLSAQGTKWPTPTYRLTRLAIWRAISVEFLSGLKVRSRPGGFAHQLLNLVRFDGNIVHEVYRTLFGHEHVVFQTDGETLFFDIDGGLAGHDPTGLNWLGGEAHVVNVETERMSEAVHEIFLKGRLIRVLAFNVAHR